MKPDAEAVAFWSILGVVAVGIGLLWWAQLQAMWESTACLK
ncbi:hypothetical protein [Candidatus Nitrospira bockiana]